MTNTDSSSSAMRWGVNALILLGITIALFIGKEIFIPTVISLFLAAMLWPMANWMYQAGVPILGIRHSSETGKRSIGIVRLHFPWGMACITVIGILIVFALLLVTAFGLGLSKFVIDAGDIKKQEDVYKTIRIKLQKLSPQPLDPEYFPEEPRDSQIFQTTRAFLNPSSESFRSLALHVGAASAAFIWQCVLIIFILLFLLLEGRMLSRRVVEIFGTSPVIQGQAVGALKDMAVQVRAYLVWRTIINFGMAAVLGVIYQFAELQLAWTWTLLTAILWYIPYLGPIVAGVPPTLDAFITCESPWVAIGLLIFYIVFVVIEGYLVVPVVMGRSMEMNATTVMLACLFWERVWGPVGLFLAMPLMAAVKAVCAHVPQWRPWANLMSSEHDDEKMKTDDTFHLTDEKGETQTLESAIKENIGDGQSKNESSSS